MMPARSCAMLALALIAALAVTSAEADCLSQYGPGCTSCATLTTGNRRLLHGGGRGAGPDRGHFGHNETGTPSLPADFLTCTACDTTGYVLKTETRGTYTFGHCECAAGWGMQTINSTGTDSFGPHHDHGNFVCVDCSATGQVPFTPTSGVSLVYSNGTWSLVLGSQGSTGGRAYGRHHGYSTTPPPYSRNQCITCLDASAPNAESTACVANP